MIERLKVIIILFIAVSFLFAGCGSTDAETGKASPAGQSPASREAVSKPAVKPSPVAPPVEVADPPDGATAEKQGMPLVTFVEIGSVNCIPCRAMQPIMKAVEDEYGEQVKVVFYDVWTPRGKADAMRYNIRVIPTQVFLDKDGKEYFRHEGYYPKEQVVRVLKMQGVR